MPDPSHGARNRGERLIVIANPRGAGGRAGAQREEIEAAVSRAFEHGRVVWTERPEHATELARSLAHETDILAALGGDGTCHEVVNGLFVEGVPVNPRVIFCVIPFGTGGDLVRSLEVPRRLEDALWIASTGTTLPLDVGRVRWQSGEERTFINVLGAGSNAEVCVRANASSKRFGGRITFLGAILQTLVSYKPTLARWRWAGPDGDGEAEVETLAAFCANAHYCGAGLWVGKGGSMADGAFDVTLIPALSAIRALAGLPHAFDGTLHDIEGARRFRATTVEVNSALPIETDGEPRAPGPLRIEVLARALHVRGGWLKPPGWAF